jgi:hypothetical protein
MDGIDDKYIEDAIAALVRTLGMRDHVDNRRLTSLLRSKKVKECIGEIAGHLGLPVEIDLSYVPREYRADNANTFSSSDLARRGWAEGGSEAITAQVSIPAYLPLYGTPGLNKFPIGVKIDENCTDNAATFIAVMAHELSHVVLHSLWHREKDNEVYTDLTAMILGFSAIMSDGRKVVKTVQEPEATRTRTTTYGYLSDEQFAFAYGRIEGALEKYRLQKDELFEKLLRLEGLAEDSRKTLALFQKYMSYVDRKLAQKMSPEDALRICACHQAGHTDTFEEALRRAESASGQLNTAVRDLNHYNEGFLATIKQYESAICAAADDLTARRDALRSDVDILKKHVASWQKLKAEGWSSLQQHR